MKIRKIINYGCQIIELLEIEDSDILYDLIEPYHQSEGRTFTIQGMNLSQTLASIRILNNEQLIYDRIILSADESKNV